MQLVKIAIAIVAVVLTPSEGAENHADNKALLSQQVANLLRGASSGDPMMNEELNAIVNTLNPPPPPHHHKPPEFVGPGAA
jgi:hypothetical protein